MPVQTLAYRTYSFSPALSIALALAACAVPQVLGQNTETSGESGSSTTTSADTDTNTDAGTSTDTGALMCDVGDGVASSGELAWSLAGAELPALFTAVATNSADQIVLAGTAAPTSADSDVHLALREADGALAWERTYAGAEGLHDQALGVVVDGAGIIHVLLREGILFIPGDNGVGESDTVDARLVVLRYAPDGTQVWRWEQTHPPVAPMASYTPDGAISRVSGGVRVLVVAANEPSIVIGLDDLGAEGSSVPLAAPAGLTIDTHAIDGDGSVLLAGDLEAPLSHALWIGRFAGDGGLTWSASFGGLDDSPTAVLADAAGGALLAWSTSLPGGIDNHLRRYDAAGVELWTATLPLMGLDSGALAATIRCDGVVLLTGGSDREPDPESAWGFRRELWIAAYGLDGAQRWAADYSFGAIESVGEGVGVAGTANGDAVVVGAFLGEDGSKSAPWLGRFIGG